MTVIVVVCLLLFCSACPGGEDSLRETEIYVSEQAGDDQTGTGTQSSPWKTIAKGTSELGKKGKGKLIIRGGFYHVSKMIELRRSGSAKQPLIISSASGEQVIISNEMNGVGGNKSNTILNIKRDDSYRGLEYITIQGIHFVGMLSIGGSSQTCKSIHLEDCVFMAHGTQLGPHNPTLLNFRNTEDCSVKRCKLLCDDPKRNDFSGIKIWKGTKRLVVEGNEISGLARKGIDNKHGMPDQALVIRNNYIHNLNERAINVNADRTVIQNNVIYKCPVGINVWKESGAPGGSFSIIDHNTIVDCVVGIVLGPESTAKLRNCTVTNNLLVNYGRGPFNAINITPYRKQPYKHGHYSNHNCFYHMGEKRYVRDRDDTLHNLREWQAVSGLDQASIETDPGLECREGSASLRACRVSEEFRKNEQSRGSDGCTMGANIVSMPDGTCYLTACSGGDSVRLDRTYDSGSLGMEKDQSPSPPRNVRIGVQ